MAEVVASYDPGADITVEAAVALTGGRCLGIPTSRNAGGPSGPNDAGDGVLVCGLPAANGGIFGVAAFDCAQGHKTYSIRAPKVCPIECNAAIAVGQEVSVNVDGTIKPKAAGQTPIGLALSATTGSGQYAQVSLYSAPVNYS